MRSTATAGATAVCDEFDEFLKRENGLDGLTDAQKKEPDLCKIDPVKWWVDHGKAKYKNLFIVAMSLLSACPTSAEAERDFSAAGLLLGTHSAHSNPKFVEVKLLQAEQVFPSHKRKTVAKMRRGSPVAKRPKTQVQILIWDSDSPLERCQHTRSGMG